MVCTARRCGVCGHAFVLKSNSGILSLANQMIFFWQSYAKHVRECASQRMAEDRVLNECGRHFLGKA